MADQSNGEERSEATEEAKTMMESTPLLRNDRERSGEEGSVKAEEDDRVGSEEAVLEQGEQPKPREADMKLDDYYRMGRYMYIVCLLAQMLLLVEVGDLLLMSFAGAAPKVEVCGFLTFDDSMSADARCKQLEELWKNETASNMYNCTREKPVEDIVLARQFDSINVHFPELYCKKESVKGSMSIQVAGIIPGSIVFGWLSDAYGRRLTMLGALVCWICSMVAASFSIDLLMFTIIRFIVCFFNGGIAVTLIVFTSELYPKKQRFCLMNLITWAPNYILFAVIAWLSGDWRTLQRVLAVLALPCIGLIIFLSESPHFLVGARKMAEARKAILRMHKIDGRFCDEALLDTVLEKEHRQMVELSAKKQNYNYLHLFYSWEFALYTLSVSFSLFVVTLITYALVYNMDTLSGSLYVNMILMGAFKYTMNLAIAFADVQFKWLGRKMSHLISEGLVIAALVIYVLLHLTHLDLQVPFMANAMLIAAVGFCGVLFNADKLAGSELFPTGVRNLSCSFGQVCSRIGFVCAPILFLLKDVCQFDFCFVIPPLILILLSALDAFFFQFVVRETKGRPLITDFPSAKN